MLSVLKNAHFSRIFAAGLASQLGSFITETALMLYIFALSGQEKSILGISKGSFLIFLTLGSLLGGPLGVRFNRKKLLIFCEFARIPFVIGLFYFHQNIPFIIIANSLIALFTGIFNPSRQTLINEITTTKEIQSANSLFSTSLAFIHMAGPFLGAWLYTYFNGVNEILSFDLFTYFIGIYLISRIHYQIKSDSEEKESHFLKDLMDGFRYIKNRRDLNAMLVCVLLTGICIGILIPLLLPFTKEYLNSDEKTYGIIMSAFGLGGIVGAPLYQRLALNIPSSKIIIIGFLMEPIIMILWTRTSLPLMSMFIIFIWGIFVFVRIPAQLTYFSKTVEVEYLSRVHSFLDMAFVIPNIFGSIVVSVIGNNLTAQETLAIVSIVFFVLMIPGIFFPGLQLLWKSNDKIS